MDGHSSTGLRMDLPQSFWFCKLNSYWLFYEFVIPSERHAKVFGLVFHSKDIYSSQGLQGQFGPHVTQ